MYKTEHEIVIHVLKKQLLYVCGYIWYNIAPGSEQLITKTVLTEDLEVH